MQISTKTVHQSKASFAIGTRFYSAPLVRIGDAKASARRKLLRLVARMYRLCDSGVVIDPTLVDSITAYFRRVANPPLAQIEHFVGQGKPRSLGAGECFCSLGQKNHEVAFIKTGIVRYFVTLPDGEEASKDFSVAGTFTLSFGSAAARLPAQVAIAAVVPTELVVWPYQQLLDLYASDIEWQKLGRRMAEVLYIRKEQRELSFLLLDAPERYRRFREQLGPFTDRIPQYYIASYLGIRPQSLSRLRKKLAEKKSIDEPG